MDVRGSGDRHDCASATRVCPDLAGNLIRRFGWRRRGRLDAAFRGHGHRSGLSRRGCSGCGVSGSSCRSAAGGGRSTARRCGRCAAGRSGGAARRSRRASYRGFTSHGGRTSRCAHRSHLATFVAGLLPLDPLGLAMFNFHATAAACSGGAAIAARAHEQAGGFRRLDRNEPSRHRDDTGAQQRTMHLNTPQSHEHETSGCQIRGQARSDRQ